MGARAELLTISKNAARVLADDLRKNVRSATVLASSRALWKDGLDSPAVKAAFARIQSINPENSWIGVADDSGVVRAATGDMLVGQSVAGRPWFEPGKLGAYVGDVHSAALLAALLPPKPDGEPLRFIDFSAPVSLDGARLGVLEIHGSWDLADDVVSKLAPERAAELGIETFIFDRGGRIVYAHGGKLAGILAAKQRLPPPAPASAAAASAVWSDGVSYLTASFPLPPVSPSIDLGWTVVTRQPATIAFAAVRHSEEAALGFGAAAAACAVLVAWTLANRLSLPLTRISTAARLVAAGSAMELPAQRGSREMVELSGALNEMTQRLLASNRDLERKVTERTAELTAANEELAQVARRDPLTGILNRRGFEERAADAAGAARRSGSTLGLVLVDADHFKRVNDQHGHAAGNTTLRALAGAMASALRESDIVARIGGEEFAALLPGADGAGALAAAEKICAAMRALSIPNVGTVTVSCGAAELAMPGCDVDEALARADAAMYQAKAQGRDQARLGAPAASSTMPPDAAP